MLIRIILESVVTASSSLEFVENTSTVKKSDEAVSNECFSSNVSVSYMWQTFAAGPILASNLLFGLREIEIFWQGVM